jgi:hypothetical protein
VRHKYPGKIERDEKRFRTKACAAGDAKWVLARVKKTGQNNRLERFRAKWIPVRVKKTRQTIGMEKALAKRPVAHYLWGALRFDRKGGLAKRQRGFFSRPQSVVSP